MQGPVAEVAGTRTRNRGKRPVGTDGEWGEIDNPGDVELYQSMIRDAELTLETPLGADDRGRGTFAESRIEFNDK